MYSTFSLSPQLGKVIPECPAAFDLKASLWPLSRLQLGFQSGLHLGLIGGARKHTRAYSNMADPVGRLTLYLAPNEPPLCPGANMALPRKPSATVNKAWV